MLKICDAVVTEPLSILLNNCADCGIFSETCKMSRIIPTCKKHDKRYINNYRPVYFLPICRKTVKELYIILPLYILKIKAYQPLINLVSVLTVPA